MFKWGETFEKFLGRALKQGNEMGRAKKAMLGNMADGGKVIFGEPHREWIVASKARASGRDWSRQVEADRGLLSGVHKRLNIASRRK